MRLGFPVLPSKGMNDDDRGCALIFKEGWLSVERLISVLKVLAPRRSPRSLPGGQARRWVSGDPLQRRRRRERRRGTEGRGAVGCGPCRPGGALAAAVRHARNIAVVPQRWHLCFLTRSFLHISPFWYFPAAAKFGSFGSEQSVVPHGNVTERGAEETVS